MDANTEMATKTEMNLKSLILQKQETINLIRLEVGKETWVTIGYFLLGNNKISFLGEKKPPPEIGEDKDKNKDCITIMIIDERAYLKDFFVYNRKNDCTQLDISIFFKFFDLVLPEIGINTFDLIDVSHKPLNFCRWKLLSVGFFTTGKTYYEKYGFKNKNFSTTDAKERIADLRSSVTLNNLYSGLQDLYNDSDKKLQEIYDEFKSIYSTLNLDDSDNLFKDDNKDNFKNMLLNDFLLKYVKRFCELGNEYAPKINYSETAIFLDSFFSDIARFLEKNGFTNSQFIKEYSPVEENLKPIMVIEESHSDYKNYKCYTIYITQQTISGGRKSNNYKKKTKVKSKNYKKKTKGKSKKYKKKNNNHINTKRRTRTKRKI